MSDTGEDGILTFDGGRNVLFHSRRRRTTYGGHCRPARRMNKHNMYFQHNMHTVIIYNWDIIGEM
jgi:hypothetical protein